MSNQQHPIGSGFGATTTAREVLKGIDLNGKIAIVTGGSAGIGLETTKALSEAGAKVIVPARSAEKARQSLAGIPRVEQGSMDLLNPASINAFAAEFLASGRPLHILINNAGIMATPFERDSRGYEIQFAANHLGHFQLAVRLWPALLKAEGARIVAVSSAGHQFANVDFDDIHFERRPYEKFVAYGQSKTANSLFAVEADRRGRENGISAFSVHPGAILTDLSQHMTDEEIGAYGLTRADVGGPVPAGMSVGEGGLFKTAEQGAATSVWCATSPQLGGIGGVYCENAEIADLRKPETTGHGGVETYAVDAEAAQRLWDVSEQLTQVRI
ncbi:SDR family NAD(P)-dependent oxidoreductase [bacterium]|nr:MAG: SDR family NAD(P)-dependent oxidoreductase [bacterium]